MMSASVLRSVARNIPLPPMNSVTAYQEQWVKECWEVGKEIGQLYASGRGHDLAWKEKVGLRADIMIDRGLRILAQAHEKKIRYYAAIGMLRFTRFNRARLEEVRMAIFKAFPDQLPVHVKERLGRIEDSMWMRQH